MRLSDQTFASDRVRKPGRYLYKNRSHISYTKFQMQKILSLLYISGSKKNHIDLDYSFLANLVVIYATPARYLYDTRTQEVSNSKIYVSSHTIGFSTISWVI